MKPSDFIEEKERLVSELKENMEVDRVAYQSGNKMNTNNPWIKITSRTFSMEFYDLDNFIENLVKFREEMVEPYKNRQGFTIDYELDINSDGGYVEKNEIVAGWRIFQEPSEKELEFIINNRIRQFLTTKMHNEVKEKNPRIVYSNSPDCKIVKLWMDGVLDWDTLKSITYSNCNL